MGQVHLGTGVRFLYRDSVHQIEEVLLDNNFVVKDLEYGRTKNYNRFEIIELMENGELKFSEYGSGTKEIHLQIREYVIEDFSKVPEKEQKFAELRLEVIRPILEDSSISVKELIEVINQDYKLQKEIIENGFRYSKKSIYRWLKLYRESNQDIRSLVSNSVIRGSNVVSHFGNEVEEMVNKYINHKLMYKENFTAQDILALVTKEINLRNEKFPHHLLKVPNIRTIQRRIKIQKGENAANKVKSGKTKNRYEKKEPTRAMEQAQFDHTRLDLFVIDGETKLALGRPWLSFIIDVFSGYPLGFYLGFEPPSVTSVMYALKHAIKSKDYVKKEYPEIENPFLSHGVFTELLVDRGKDFKSKALDVTCKQLGIKLEFTPPRSPWYKGEIERYFGSLNKSLLHKLPGTSFSNTVELKHRDYDPQKNAIITLDELIKLFHKWLIDVYSVSPHKGVGGVPLLKYQESTNNLGDIPIRTFNKDFEIVLGKICSRNIQTTGITMDYLTYKSLKLIKLREYLLKTKGTANVEFRFSPDDISKIYVFDEVHKKHIEVPCTYKNYSPNMRHYVHLMHVKDVKEKGYRVDESSLLRAVAYIQEQIEELRHSKKIADRQKAERARGSGSNKLQNNSQNTSSRKKKAINNDWKKFDPHGLKSGLDEFLKED